MVTGRVRWQRYRLVRIRGEFCCAVYILGLRSGRIVRTRHAFRFSTTNVVGVLSVFTYIL